VVLKDGSIIDKFIYVNWKYVVDLVDRHEKCAYMFGRLDLCEFVLEHPTIYRFHECMLLMITNSCSQFDRSESHVNTAEFWPSAVQHGANHILPYCWTMLFYFHG
jgi:hypothetical protein